MNKRYTALVEDINDPLEANRARVRVLGVHSEDRSVIPTPNLPWADIIMPPSSAGTSGVSQVHGLLQGSWVTCEFRDEELQIPIITGVIGGRESTGGLLDTSGLKYPIRSGNSLPYETSRKTLALAPSYADKAATRQIDVPCASPAKVTSLAPDKDPAYYEKKTWTAPDPTSYIRPKYPHNKVERSASGHVREIDSTPGSERSSDFHPSGTYREITPVGDEIIVVRGSKYTTIFSDDNVYVKGSVNLTVEGDVRHLVKGNYHLEVDGDFTQDVKGNFDSKIGKSKNEEVLQDNGLNVAENDIRRIGVNSRETIGNDKSLNVGANVAAIIAGTTMVTSIGAATLVSPANVSIASGTKMAVVSADGLKVESGGNIDINSDGAINVTSAAAMSFDSGSMTINTGAFNMDTGEFTTTVSGGSFTGGSTIVIAGNTMTF